MKFDLLVERSDLLGIVCLVFGILFTEFSIYLLSNTTLTALGIGCIILGVTVIMLPSTPVPMKLAREMVEDSCVNIEALLEEFDVKEKAIYYPPNNNRVFAFTPFKPGAAEKPLITDFKDPVRVGVKDGLIVFPPCSNVVQFSAGIKNLDIEKALYEVLVNTLEVAEGVKVIRTGNVVHIQLKKPRIGTEFPRFIQVLGSLPISIAGCVLAIVLNTPLAYDGEESKDSTVTATFRLVTNG